VALTALSLVAVPLVDRPDDGPTTVAAGPPTPAGATAADAFAARTRIEYSLPDGWQVLDSDAYELVVATRPLSDRDRQLAGLTRSDAAFTAFPADAVVLAVGLDPLQAKYGTEWDGADIDPGPAYGLGPERALPGGVRFRRGDVPQSMVRIASYAGPAASAARQGEAEAIAAGIRVLAPADPVPPPASTTVPQRGLTEVARAVYGTSSLVLEAGDNCAGLRSPDSQAGAAGLARGCAARPAGSEIDVVSPAVVVWGQPGAAPATAAILRSGPGVQSVSAQTADGRSFPAVVGADGWGVALVPGRIVELVALDRAGREVAEVFVP
jgi:hypothetical protein